VKFGFKFQSLGKIANISTFAPPPSSFRSIPTLGEVAPAATPWSDPNFDDGIFAVFSRQYGRACATVLRLSSVRNDRAYCG